MIRVFEYGIDSDPLQYIAGEIRTKKIVDKESGTEKMVEYIYRPQFYSTLAGACRALLQLDQRKAVASGEYSLKQALTVLDELQQRYESELRRIEEVENVQQSDFNRQVDKRPRSKANPKRIECV